MFWAHPNTNMTVRQMRRDFISRFEMLNSVAFIIKQVLTSSTTPRNRFSASFNSLENHCSDICETNRRSWGLDFQALRIELRHPPTGEGGASIGANNIFLSTTTSGHLPSHFVYSWAATTITHTDCDFERRIEMAKKTGPYVGVTGFTSRAEVKKALAMIPEGSKRR